jgi:hypothetical protein
MGFARSDWEVIMRIFLMLAGLVLAMGAGPGARAQSFQNGFLEVTNELPAVQNGLPGSVIFTVPAIDSLGGWNLSIAYSSLVFEDLSPASFSSGYFFIDVDPGVDFGPPNAGVSTNDFEDYPQLPPLPLIQRLDPADLAMLAADSIKPVPEYHQVNVLVMHSDRFSLLEGENLLTVEFRLRDNAVPGDTKVFFAGTYYDFDLTQETVLSATVSTSIAAAVPEPQTWAMMFAGLVLVGGALARARRQVRS